jgi:propionyl-CoA synthetase
LAKFPGYYFSGDGAIKTKKIIFLSQEELMTLSTLQDTDFLPQMEEAVSGHKDVAECCVVGIEDELKGQIPFGLAVKIWSRHF